MATANIVLAALGFISWMLWAITHKKRWRYAVAPLSVFLHAIIFYVVILYFNANPGTLELHRAFINTWSTSLRFHELILLTGAGIFLSWERVKRWITRQS